MHELTLCRQMLTIIQQQQLKQNFQRVVRLDIELGQLSCIDKIAFSFCFNTISKNTIAQSAEINYINIDAVINCNTCQQRYTIANKLSPCPNCNEYDYQLIQGDEIKLKQMEVV